MSGIDRPVRYGWGHNPHEEDGVSFADPHDPLGFWDDINEMLDQWKQSAAPDSTPRTDG